jgi:acyl-CoA reductase-like NAD-dependent aldehyde dehydrogenase
VRFISSAAELCAIATPSAGYFVGPTVLQDLPTESEVARTEIFGPVLSVHNVRDIDEAIRLVNSGAYGNQACLFTTSGASARKFRYEAEVGNVGINVGVGGDKRKAQKYRDVGDSFRKLAEQAKAQGK